MAFEETAHHPLANAVADGRDHDFDTGFILNSHFGDGFAEEDVERIQRVLIHVIDHIQSDNQEIEHSAFSSNGTIDFSLFVNLDFGVLGHFALHFDILRSLLCDIQLLNEFFVVQNRCGIGFGKRLQEFLF